MLDWFKVNVGDQSKEDIALDKYIEESKVYHGRRATAHSLTYQNERQWKSNYILVNVVAEGYDIKRFLEMLVKDKGSTPNIDFFTRDELKQIIRDFKQATNEGKLDDITSASALDSSTARMFDQAMNRRRSNSVLRRRQTQVAEDTVLSRNQGSTCIVTGLNQYITSSLGNYVRTQSQMITIETYPMKWSVKRLDTDFITLRDYLLRTYPQTIIPPLPNESKKKLTRHQTQKRMTYYQRFLNLLMRSQILKSSKFLVAFLSETSQEAFNVKLLTIEEEVGPKNIFEFKTLTGEIETEARAKATKFCDGLDTFGKQYQKMNELVCKYVKELQLRSHELADDYYAIGACVNSLQELLKMADIPQAVHFYKRISDLIIKTGDFTLETGELMNHQCGSWFKYQKQAARCFKESHWLRDESLSRYVNAKTQLMKKKEKLFKEKNVSKWEIPAEKAREAVDIMNDAEAAFEMMLPADSKKVAYMAEESAYFTNQCHKEARRVIMQDYAGSRFHFVDMGEQMHRHIYELNLAWGQFLDFYTDLNNARKERDEKYMEEAFIGEEIIEPDEDADFPFTHNLGEDDKDEADTGELLSSLKEEIKQEDAEKASQEEEGSGEAFTVKTTEVIEQ